MKRTKINVVRLVEA